MKNNLPPTCDFNITDDINCESTWPGLICDNSLLTINANHIDDPNKVEDPRYMHAWKAFIEYLFCSHCPRLNQLI